MPAINATTPAVAVSNPLTGKRTEQNGHDVASLKMWTPQEEQRSRREVIRAGYPMAYDEVNVFLGQLWLDTNLSFLMTPKPIRSSYDCHITAQS